MVDEDHRLRYGPVHNVSDHAVARLEQLLQPHEADAIFEPVQETDETLELRVGAHCSRRTISTIMIA